MAPSILDGVMCSTSFRQTAPTSKSQSYHRSPLVLLCQPTLLSGLLEVPVMIAQVKLSSCFHGDWGGTAVP